MLFPMPKFLGRFSINVLLAGLSLVDFFAAVVEAVLGAAATFDGLT